MAIDIDIASSTPSRSVLQHRFQPPRPCPCLLRPLLTPRSGSPPLPFQDQGEASPGKNAPLHRTTAASTPPRLDHKSFAVSGPLALLGNAFYPVLVHRLAIYATRFLPTIGHPLAVALHFVRRDQLTAGLAPAGVRPCWAHQKKRAPRAWSAHFNGDPPFPINNFPSLPAPADRTRRHRRRRDAGRRSPRRPGCTRHSPQARKPSRSGHREFSCHTRRVQGGRSVLPFLETRL